MPWQQPKTLTNDEVYALTAYILAPQTRSSAENDVMNAEDPAQGEDAQPRRLHQQVPGEALVTPFIPCPANAIRSHPNGCAGG